MTARVEPWKRLLLLIEYGKSVRQSYRGGETFSGP